MSHLFWENAEAKVWLRAVYIAEILCKCQVMLNFSTKNAHIRDFML